MFCYDGHYHGYCFGKRHRNEEGSQKLFFSLHNLLVSAMKMTNGILVEEIVMIITHYSLMGERANAVTSPQVLLRCSKTQSQGDLAFQPRCSLNVGTEKRKYVLKLLCLKCKQSILKTFFPYLPDWGFNQDIWQWGNVCLASCCLLVNIWLRDCWQSLTNASFV